ncbi:VirD4-like conjugal transfer protein, CD1115 family [Virgibacillus salexigens]|uniref:Uncharacterized protein n=1 Tax=Virgibacillus kapii TaxID=1638645 RepID=A0ABQ2DX77_9BACI|nr:type IV secretory system conjugative DNA transfer family protein [Virgibacillus kapii]GGJ75499.1 hypothetical protein GCM10007111_41310 [Virgibacillus kapii]
MKKRKLKKGAGSKLFVAGILTIIVAYTISALTYGLFAQINLMDGIKDFEGVLNFLTTTERINLLIPIILTVLCLGWFLKTFDIWEKNYKDASGFGVKGTAKWGNPQDVVDGKTLSKNSDFSTKNLNKSLGMGEGIIVGKVPNNNTALIIPKNTNLDTMNVYVNGPSGSGKGQSYVYTNLINIRNENIIVIDPKGENYHVTAQLKRDQGYKVYNIDFADFSSSGYNPLDYVKNDEDAQKISTIMADNSKKDDKQDFFAERAQKLLAALMSYVKATYPKEQANMETLIKVYKKYVVDEEICYEWLQGIPVDHPAKELLESILLSLESKTRTSVISSFDSVIAIFQFQRIKDMTKKSDFTFDEFQEQKSVLYVKIKVPTNPYSALTSVFFSQMIDRFFELGDMNPIPELDIPVHFLLDEFPNIGKIGGYQNTLSLCRGYKIYMHTIVQDISQLQDKRMYGMEATKTIIANHSAKLILKVGEKEGAKYWSDWIGNTTLEYGNDSTSISDKGSTKSKSHAYEQRALLPPNELMNMDNNIAYLLLSGHDPLEVEKSWQFKLFPNLLFDNNRKPNYNHIRKKLGYTSPIAETKTKKNNAVNFSDYQKQNSQPPVNETNEERDSLSNEEMDTNNDSDELTEEELKMLFGTSEDDVENENTRNGDADTTDELNEIEKEIALLNAIEDDIDQDALEDAVNAIADEESGTPEVNKQNNGDTNKKEESMEELPM